MRRYILLFLAATFSGGAAFAQAPSKEAMNSFALYSNTGEFSNLEKAKGFIDKAMVTRKDSSSSRNNLTKALVYSSLAFADSTRKLKYVKDPIAETNFALSQLIDPKFNDEHKPELDFVKSQMSKAWMVKANKALAADRVTEAYKAFLEIDNLYTDIQIVNHNLALLSEKLGRFDKAIFYYERLVDDKKTAIPDYYLALSNLYDIRNPSKSITILQEGRKAFPENRDILFKLINLNIESGAYGMVEVLVKDAIKLDPGNPALNYLAGFAYDLSGKSDKAIEYYKHVLEFDADDFESNYALGLLYLKSYIKANEAKKDDYMDLARRYLVKSGEINPNSVKVLQSLAILYNNNGDIVELEKVNNRLKQFNLLN